MKGGSAEKKMGLFMATVIVVVNMIGTGIFLLPASMATIGSISIYGWIVATIGATALAIVFAMLGAQMPKAGGPYAYARDTLGPYVGFQTNYIYWVSNLVGNIAVAATVTGYVVELFPVMKGTETICTVAMIWIATAINIAGPRCVGLSTSWGTMLAMVPLIFVAVGGWVWFDADLFRAGWNPHHESSWAAISASVPFALWAYMGIESAAVDSEVIENPKRNVPLATILGLVIAAVLYISTCVVLMGIIPMDELAKSSAPFSDAALRTIGPWAAVVIAICAVLKTGSSLIGWTLNVSESARSAATDGLFPSVYGKTDRRGIPLGNFLISGVLMSLIVVATASPSLNDQFNEIVNMSVILVVLPYLYSVVSYLDCEWTFATSPARRWFAVFIVIVACGYCLWVTLGSVENLTRDALILLFLSVPLYPIFKRGMKVGPSLGAGQ
jgi:arginine:agmatine antiporter